MDDFFGLPVERHWAGDMGHIEEASLQANELKNELFKVEVLLKADIDGAGDAITSGVSNHIVVEV